MTESLESKANKDANEWEDLSKKPESTSESSSEDSEAERKKEENLQNIESQIDTLSGPLEHEYNTPYITTEDFAVFLVKRLHVDPEYAKDHYSDIINDYSQNVHRNPDKESARKELRRIAESLAEHQTDEAPTSEQIKEITQWARQEFDNHIKASRESEQQPEKQPKISRAKNIVHKLFNRKRK